MTEPVELQYLNIDKITKTGEYFNKKENLVADLKFDLSQKDLHEKRTVLSFA